MFFIELNHQDQPIGHVWCCSRCDTKGRPEFFSVQATSSAADHLRKAHRITPASQSNPSDDSAIDLQSHATPKRPRLDQSIIPKAKVKAVQELSVGFVIDSDVPFTIFEHKFLKELFYQFDHELALQIPWSSSSITRELQKIFESKADIIKAELGSALTKIHISFDLWTSPNRLAIMAVFAHFIDKFGNQQSRLLALRRQLGIHSGEILAETLFEIVQLWDIRGQVGKVISDNVTTNDTCLSYFYRQLNPSIRPADIKARRMRCYGHVLNLVARAFLFGKDAESFELESDINGMRGLQEQDLRHWRSKGPIGKLHNIVKFIRSSPQRSEYFKRIAHEQEDEGYHLCEESTAELDVILNNETRWNSTYMMMERALRKQTDIRAYIFALEGEKDEEKRIPADDILSKEDWRVLGEVNEILTPLYHQTMRTQGWGKGDSHGRLWEVLVGMEYLLEHFEDWKGFYNEFTTETIRATNLNDPELIGRASAPLRGTNTRSARSRRRPARFDGEEVYVSQQRSQAPTFTVAALPEHSQAEYAELDKPPASKISQKSSLPADHRAYIRASINNGWKKLDEYYSKLGESPLFAAAVILHPRFGISWLEATWATEEQLAWVRDAKAGIKDYFARWYQSNQRTDDLQSKSASSLTNRGKEDDHYTQWINSRTKKAFATSSSVSEMDKYLRLEPQDTQEPIQWWRDHKPSFPVLSSFALDVFAIPAMATDCERQFSLAKLTLTSQRLAMGADTLERVHCLRNWVRHGGAWCHTPRAAADGSLYSWPDGELVTPDKLAAWLKEDILLRRVALPQKKPRARGKGKGKGKAVQLRRQLEQEQLEAAALAEAESLAEALEVPLAEAAELLADDREGYVPPTALAPAAADLAEGSLLTRGTIDAYIAAVIELWRLQVAHGNANTENPRGAAVRGFLEQRGRQRGKHDRASFKDRGTDGIQAGYSPDEWLRVQDLLLSRAAYMPQNLRTRVDLLFGHYYLLRGENRRKMELADLSLLDYPSSEGPTPCGCLVTLLRDETWRIFGAAGLMASKKTHLPRRVGAQDAETHGTSLAQISQAGRWNQSVLCQAYLTHLPRQFMHIIAGFSALPGDYFLAHAAYEPPYVLQKQLWPWIEEWEPRFEACARR
ncbi:putative AC transposase [Fusarium oxysporum f. sp. conglutinans]|nr:putative AC transposase [Fusarium oxysporum f. sp. conglutinans]